MILGSLRIQWFCYSISKVGTVVILELLLTSLLMAPLPARASNASTPAIEANPNIPFFEESAGVLVLRFNPDSEVVKHPAIRDAVASILLIGIKDEATFPRAFRGSSTLKLSAPAFTGPIMEYDEALIDFGGPERSIEALARSAGLAPVNEMTVLSSLGPRAMTNLGSGRPTMRRILQQLTEAGYRIDNGRLIAADETPIEITLAIGGQYLPLQQRDALKSAAGLLSRLGIAARIRESYAPDTKPLFAESDAMIALEQTDLYGTLLGWVLSSEWSATPVDVFLDSLPKDLSRHQEITVMAVLDAYLSATGHAVALAEMTSSIDYSERSMRAFAWHKAEVMAYIDKVCGENANISLAGQSKTELAFRNKDHPLVMYLPLRGGSGEDLRVALIATEEQVGIPNRGFLRVERPETLGTNYPEWLSNKLPISIPVERLSRALVLKDPEIYLELAREVELRRSEGDITTAHMLFQHSTDNGLRSKQPVVDDIISAKALIEHELAGVPGCAGRIYDSHEKLTFSSLTSVE